MTNSNNTKEQTRKFFIYARKSTDSEDRQIRSIGDQISELQELAKKENLEIVDTIVEKQTAKKPGRPLFAEMLKRLEAGEAVGILAWHPDRLASLPGRPWWIRAGWARSSSCAGTWSLRPCCGAYAEALQRRLAEQWRQTLGQIDDSAAKSVEFFES